MNIEFDYSAGTGVLTLYPKNYSNIALLLNEIEKIKNNSDNSLLEEINSDLNDSSLQVDTTHSEWTILKSNALEYQFLFSLDVASDYENREDLEDDMYSMMFPDGNDDLHNQFD